MMTKLPPSSELIDDLWLNGVIRKRILIVVPSRFSKVIWRFVHHGNTNNCMLNFCVFLRMQGKKGHRVDFNWIWSKARKIQRAQTDNPDATIGRHVIQNVIKRNNIKMRARQRNKVLPKAEFTQKLKEWHATTREQVLMTITMTNGVALPPNSDIIVDQSPCPFALNLKKNVSCIRRRCWSTPRIRCGFHKPGSGLDKRQCSLQICVRPTGIQPTSGYCISRLRIEN